MTTTNATDPRDYPAAEGRTVTEGHAQLCRERGHATTIRDGVDQGVCPRCGEVTAPNGGPLSLDEQVSAFHDAHNRDDGHDVRRMWRTDNRDGERTPTYLFCLTCNATVDEPASNVS